jgi:hypothetical protein
LKSGVGPIAGLAHSPASDERKEIQLLKVDRWTIDDLKLITPHPGNAEQGPPMRRRMDAGDGPR